MAKAILSIGVDASSATKSLVLLDEEMQDVKHTAESLDELIDRLTESLHKNANYTEGSVKALRAEKRMLIELRDSLAETSTDYQLYNQRIDAINLDLQTLTRRQDDTVKSSKQLSSTAGKTGATLTEFGRVIADAPYGIMGVANNIEQLTQQFVDLQTEEGSTRGALKKLFKGLIGPNGIIIAIQVVTAAMVFFSKQQREATEATEGLDDALLKQGKTMAELATLANDESKSGEERLRILRALSAGNEELREIVDEENISVEKRVELGNRLVKLQQEERDINAKANEELKKKNKQFANVTLTEAELEKVRQRRDKLQKLVDDGYIERQGKRIDFDLETRRTQKQLLNQAIRDIELIEKGIPLRDEIINQLNAQRDSQQSVADVMKEFEQLQKDSIPVSDSLIAQLKAQIEKVTKQRDETAKTKDEIYEYNRQLTVLQNRLNELMTTGTIEQDIILDIQAKGYAGEEAAKFAKALKKNAEKFGITGTEALLGKNAEEVTEEFVNLYKGIDDKTKPLKEKLTFEEGLAHLKEGLSALNELFSAQAEKEIAIEEKKTIAVNDQLRRRLANEQLSASERDKINQEIARNEAALIEKQNKLEEKRFNQQKTANIAMATIDTFAAASGVLAETKGGSVARIAGMIAVITAGLANVASIAAQEFVPKALPNPRLSAQGAIERQSPSFNVVGASQTNQLAEAIASADQQPLRAYVVASDVTSAQALERGIVEGASI